MGRRRARHRDRRILRAQARSRPLPPGRSLSSGRLLGAAEFTSSTGDGAFFATSALYFTSIIGLSVPEVGLILALGWGLGAVAGVPLGRLADARGPRGTAALLAIAVGITVMALMAAVAFVPFVLGVCAFTCCQTGLQAARQALLAALVDPAERTRVRARLQAIRNAGIAIGAAMGGVALFLGDEMAYLAVFGLVAVCFLITAGVFLRLPPIPPSSVAAPGEPRLAVLRDRPYALISFLNMILQLHMPLLSVVLPLWIAQRTAAPEWTVSAMWAINTTAIVLLQVRVARRVTDLTSAGRTVRIAGLILAAACLVFALSAGGDAIAAVAVILTGAALMVAGEMLQASGAWEISFGLAPDGRHGQYQGFFGMGLAGARMIGPMFATLVIWTGTPGWLVLAGLFLVSGLAMAPAVRLARRTRATTP